MVMAILTYISVQKHTNLSNRTIICCYQMLHIYSVHLFHLQIAKYEDFLIKIQVFTDFSAKLKILKISTKLKVFKGFKGSPRCAVCIFWACSKARFCLMQHIWYKSILLLSDCFTGEVIKMIWAQLFKANDVVS